MQTINEMKRGHGAGGEREGTIHLELQDKRSLSKNTESHGKKNKSRPGGSTSNSQYHGIYLTFTMTKRLSRGGHLNVKGNWANKGQGRTSDNQQITTVQGEQATGVITYNEY